MLTHIFVYMNDFKRKRKKKKKMLRKQKESKNFAI